MNTVGLIIAIIAAVAMDSFTYGVLLFKEDWKNVALNLKKGWRLLAWKPKEMDIDRY